MGLKAGPAQPGEGKSVPSRLSRKQRTRANCAVGVAPLKVGNVFQVSGFLLIM